METILFSSIQLHIHGTEVWYCDTQATHGRREALLYSFFFFLFSKLFLISNAEKILRIWLNIDVESVVSGGKKRINIKG